MDELEHVKEKEFRHNFRMICLSVIDQEQPLDSPFTPVLQFTIPMKEAQKPYSYSLLTVMLAEMALHLHFLHFSMKYQIITGAKVTDPSKYAVVKIYLHVIPKNAKMPLVKDTMFILSLMVRMINNLAITTKGTPIFEVGDWKPIIFKEKEKPNFVILPIAFNLSGGHTDIQR